MGYKPCNLHQLKCLSLVNLGQWSKKWFNASLYKPPIEVGLSLSKKQNLNFFKWLWPTQR